MDKCSHQSYSSRSRRDSHNSSSLSSFSDSCPKKKRKTDRMVYSIDKSSYQWSQTNPQRKHIKLSKLLNSKNASSQIDFQDYLSDNLSQDSQSFKEMVRRNSLKNKYQVEKGRKIIDKPFKKTYFKNWQDNFYTNLLDWNCQNFIFAADDEQISQYHLSSFSSKQAHLHQQLYIKGSKINSIKCSPTHKNIAIAYDCGTIRFYNYENQKTLSINCLHAVRVTALDWSQRCILTGSKDRSINMLDQRTFKQTLIFDPIHKQQVLGIKRCGNLIASGGNDNLVAIFDIRKALKPFYVYQHQAAVKSLEWIESQKILLSGGGTSDKKIKFWDFKQNKIVKQIQTGSQVCNLIVSKNTKQFISCLGFSQNQIVLWDLDGKRIESLHGKHSTRVLYSALSPSGQYLATGAGDKNLLIWKMFPSSERRNKLMEKFDLR